MLSAALLPLTLGCARPPAKPSDTATDSAQGLPEPALCEGELCWVTLSGGAYWMGSPEEGGEPEAEPDERPAHEVWLDDFEVMRAEVTVAQYAACVGDGACAPRASEEELPSRCNWGVAGREDHPMNCITWYMADDFCAWAGGALLSEARWEYAARSGGLDQPYPWGDAAPSCELAVLNEDQACGADGTWPVCSKPDGHTAQGLCDMAGNAFEWLADWYHSDYVGAPTDGSPWTEPPGDARVMRGGSINSAVTVRSRDRTFHEPDFFFSGMGARCGRDL